MASIPLSRFSPSHLYRTSFKAINRVSSLLYDTSLALGCESTSLCCQGRKKCRTGWNVIASKIFCCDYGNENTGYCDDDCCAKGSYHVDRLVQILQQSVDEFISAIRSHEFSQNQPQLANAWVGIDVHSWHKSIAYEAAVYALLHLLVTLMREPHQNVKMNRDAICNILSPAMDTLEKDIESKMSKKYVKLMDWLKMEQLPLFKEKFTSILEKWRQVTIQSLSSLQTSDHVRKTRNSEEVAIASLAVGCCVEVSKLRSQWVPCSFQCTVTDIILQLMDVLSDLVQINELHHLSCVSGFEHQFLSHFGSKATRFDSRKGMVFWMSLVQRKLIVAFQREGLFPRAENLHKPKGFKHNLAALGLFALLGLQTRLLLSSLSVKNVDEPVKDFLSFLECGSLFIYPELSSLSSFQIYLEVVFDEIGWLNFYNTRYYCTRETQKRRSKHHPIQAEREIIFSSIFKVCSDVFSIYANYVKSTHQCVDDNMMNFLLRSQNLMDICLEDYGSAYYRELLSVGQRSEQDVLLELNLMNTSTTFEVYKRSTIDSENARVFMADCHTPTNMVTSGRSLRRIEPKYLEKDASAVEGKLTRKNFLKKSSEKLMSTSTDIWIGTRLLLIDLSIALQLIWKQFSGKTLTNRERKKLSKTLSDVLVVIPVAILMLLPVSPIGHAAMLAAIKRYTPCLIPSAYSSERVGTVKQLDRAKRMELVIE